jgi:uncharacterized protein (DUF433 family)
MPSATPAPDTYSAAEVSAVTGAPMRAVYKAAEQRLPASMVVRHGRERRLTRWGAVCFAIDRAMPRNVPLEVRRQLYTDIQARRSAAPARCQRGVLSYVVDVRCVADRIDAALRRYRNALALIVEDPAIQGGAATFRGTRILVHQIAALIEQGVAEAELREDYPRLTAAMIAAAPIYAQAHPRRGRPRKPAWRNAATLSDTQETGRQSPA